MNQLPPQSMSGEDGLAGEQSALTPRQQQILELLKAGKVNKEIANELGIGLGTVKQHMVALFKKLNVRNRAMAVSQGLTRSMAAPVVAEMPWVVDSMLERRPCIVLSIILPSTVTPHALTELHHNLTAFALANDALLLTRKENAVELIFGIRTCTEYDIYKAYHAGQTVFKAMSRFAGVCSGLRAGLAAGMAIVSMKRHGGCTGEVIASSVIAQAREIAHQAMPATVNIDAQALALLQVFGAGPVDTTLSMLPFEALARMPWGGDSATPPVLIGRDEEIARLHTWLVDVGRGQNRVVYLEGETGMGKSGLCRYLAASYLRRGGRVQHFVCMPKSLTGNLYRFPDGLAVGPATLTQCLQDTGSALVIVDDCHLLPGELLIDISRQSAAASNKLVILAGRRLPREAAPADETLKLGRLSPQAVAALVSACLHGVESKVLTDIAQRALGVPLFATALAQRYPDSAMPFILRVVIAARMDGLKLDRAVLAQLARSPAAHTIGDLALALHEPAQTVRLAVEQAIASGVLQENDLQQLSFTHPLLRQAVAESLVE